MSIRTRGWDRSPPFHGMFGLRSRSLRAFGYATEKDVYQGLSHHDTAPDMARALTQSGWLPQFRVFNSLHQAGLATEGDSHAWARRPPLQLTRRRTRALAMRHGWFLPGPAPFAPLIGLGDSHPTLCGFAPYLAQFGLVCPNCMYVRSTLTKHVQYILHIYCSLGSSSLGYVRRRC